MPKSRDAFRTISEVAEWLDTQPHVLRFWESKFSQVRPVKRAGGRRYYRPADMQLLGGIKKLLHDDGMTIKGVQKLLREKGIKEISALSKPVDRDEAEAAAIEATIARELPEAIEKPDVDPLEEQISEIVASETAGPSEEDGEEATVDTTARESQESEAAAPPTDVEAADEAHSPEDADSDFTNIDLAPAPKPKNAVPRNPLADVAESWSMREKLIAALMTTQDIDARHHAEMARSLAALKSVVSTDQSAGSS
ncbi:MerR family transcriptional regulator [Cognatishimia sp.]|uniref:MerR family transcriptional regulator n=1 Tax=Cognatishimia sp. TaxID=2211648 RepID=UPI00351881B5